MLHANQGPWRTKVNRIQIPRLVVLRPQINRTGKGNRASREKIKKETSKEIKHATKERSDAFSRSLHRQVRMADLY